jgi:hypothetical protein
MGNYDRFSNFNKDNNFSFVRFGATPLMETELQESQQIQLEKFRDFIRQYVGNGIFGIGTFVYTTGVLTISNEKAIVDGNLLTISTLSLALAEGESAYLDIWEEELTKDSTIKKYGNQQETTTMPNSMFDNRTVCADYPSGQETARRYQLKYNLVKATGVSGHTYYKLAHIASGTLVMDATNIFARLNSLENKVGAKLIESTTQPTNPAVGDLWLDSNTY